MNIKKMVTTIAYASLAMVAWTTYKVYFVHDPDNFFEPDARPYAVSWIIDHCKSYACDNSGGSAIKGIAEAEEGFLYLLATKGGGEIVLLVPRDEPRNKHLVEIDEDDQGNLKIIDKGVSEQEKSASRSNGTSFAEMSGRKQGKYIAGVIALVLMGLVWLYKRRNRPTAESLALSSPETARAAAVVIGSRIAKEAAPEPAAPSLDKASLQYKSALAMDKAKGLELGRAYIASLLEAGRGSDAVTVFNECRAADAAFRLAQPEQVLPMAKAAMAAGDTHAAVAALRGFDKAYPGHSLIPDVYVFSAKLMAGSLGNIDMAKKLLEHVIARYPGHHLAQEAKRELQAIA